VANLPETRTFLYVELDHLARRVRLVAALGRGRFEIAEPAQALPAQDPADGGRRDAPVLRAICAPVGRLWRSTTIRAQTASGVGARRRFGRDDRSKSPAKPSASNRRHQFTAVFAAQPQARPASP